MVKLISKIEHFDTQFDKLLQLLKLLIYNQIRVFY